MTRDELLTHLATLAGQLNGDELTILTRVAAKLMLDQRSHGGLRIIGNPRDLSAAWQESLLEATIRGAIFLENA